MLWRPTERLPIQDGSTSESTWGLYLSSQQDTQRLALETINKILQMIGQYLTVAGYSILFEIFGAVAGDDKRFLIDERMQEPSIASTVDIQLSKEAEKRVAVGRLATTLSLIRVAFPSLQLICTDFLSVLNAENLRRCIRCVGAFASQGEDLNISLTSIGLLWSICDFVKNLLRSVQYGSHIFSFL